MRRFLLSSQAHILYAVIIAVVVATHLLRILWVNQDAFTKSYDIAYWKDRVEHSQWELPASKRIIGDDGLYSYVGYKIALGEDLTVLNPETGPVGKYLLGYSILFFHTPAVTSFMLGLGILGLFYFLSQFFLKDRFLSLLLTGILSFDPLFFSQFTGSWVDLPQLFFLLLFLVLFLYGSLHKKQILYMFLTGISLGIFSDVKFPILTPILFLFVCISLSLSKKWQSLLSFIFGCSLGFLFPYMAYLSHHSLKEFISLQKYIIAFYMKSHLPVHHFAIWQTLILGKFPDIVSGRLSKYQEWWIVLPIITLLGLGGSIWTICKKNISFSEGFLVAYVIFTSIIFSFIPFYPRYVLLLFPILLLISAIWLIRIWKYIAVIDLLLAFLVGIITSMLYLTYSPVPIITNMSYNLSHGYFQDVYQEDITNTKELRISREEFQKIGQSAFQNGEIISIDIKIGSPQTTREGLEVPITELYQTRRLGNFQEKKTILLSNQHGKWKVQWDWNLVFNKFSPGEKVVSDVIPGKRGAIKNLDGTISSSDTDGYLVSIIPSQINSALEPTMLHFFSQLSYMKPVGLQNAYLENPLPDSPIPLFSSFTPWNSTTLEKLKSYPGVSVTMYPSRIYASSDPESIGNTTFLECCTRIYTSSTYHGLIGTEKTYDSILSAKDGGNLSLFDKNGILIRVVTQRQPQNGHDVTLNL